MLAPLRRSHFVRWCPGFIIAAVIAMAAIMIAPAFATTSSPSPGTGTTIMRIGLLEDADNLNPFIMQQVTSYMVIHLNYDFLVGFDPKQLTPRPEIATSWSLSADQKTWTFHIRHGMTWQDGQPVTAKDVAFTFNYIVKNKLNNVAVYTYGITGAKAIDDYTCEVYTNAPKSNMLSMVVAILPQHIWSKISGKAASTSYANNPPIVGSGPFQTVQWKRGQYIELKANKTYWKGAPHIDELFFEIYTNANSMVADLKAGALDGAVDVPMAQFAALKNVPGLTGITATSWRFTELGFNCYDSPNSMGNPVLLDQRFRQALQYAINRPDIVSTAFNGYAQIGSTTIVPYSRFHYQPPANMLYTYDPAKANAMLDAAGYKMGPSGIRLDKHGKPINLRLLVTNDYPPNMTTARLVAGWLKQVGIGTKLTVVDAGGMLAAQYNYKGNTFAPNYDMFIWYWTGDPDPYFNVTVPTTGQIQGWNDTCWTNPLYDKLAVQQAQTLDFATRKSIIDKMQQIIFAGSPYLVFAYPYQLEVYNTAKWAGYVNAPSGFAGYTGSALYPYTNIDTYVNVHLKPASSTGNSTNWGLIAGGVGAAAVIVVVIIVLMRRRPRATEEAA
jgi:peptide/nickel transport system substrate-binding protein